MRNITCTSECRSSAKFPSAQPIATQCRGAANATMLANATHPLELRHTRLVGRFIGGLTLHTALRSGQLAFFLALPTVGSPERNGQNPSRAPVSPCLCEVHDLMPARSRPRACCGSSFRTTLNQPLQRALNFRLAFHVEAVRPRRAPYRSGRPGAGSRLVHAVTPTMGAWAVYIPAPTRSLALVKPRFRPLTNSATSTM